MQSNELVYKIALSLLSGIGPKLAKNLIAYTGSPEAVFAENVSGLKKIPGIGDKLAAEIINTKAAALATKELAFIEKHKIIVRFYLDNNFPERLKHCPDSPIILFGRGKDVLNETKIISIVGTRNATPHGKVFCEKLVEDLAASGHRVVIVSGLAYGIDICAHKAALKHGLPTIGVLAHGFDRIYPAVHASTAKEMLKTGGLITEFTSGHGFARENFLKRNRIIAGLADATVIVESAEKGGSLVTADIASSYDRDVFAVPGRISDEYSKGCNKLIRTNRASLIESYHDFEYLLGWDKLESDKHMQQKLFVELTDKETKICNILKTGDTPIDAIAYQTGFGMNKLSAMLLEMEFKGVVKPLPGKVFSLV